MSRDLELDIERLQQCLTCHVSPPIFNFMITYSLFHRMPASISISEAPASRMEQGQAVKSIVSGAPVSFAAEAGRCVAIAVENCKKGRDGLFIKAAECCPGELDSVCASAVEFLHSARTSVVSQAIKLSSFFPFLPPHISYMDTIPS